MVNFIEKIYYNLEKIIINIIFANICVPLIIKTKTGKKVLSFFKHIWYFITNQNLNITISVTIKFNADTEIETIKTIKENCCNNEQIKLLGCKINSTSLYLGDEINFDIDIISEHFDEIPRLYFRGKECNINYRNFYTLIKNKTILNFLKIINNKTAAELPLSEYRITYQARFKFTNSKNNFFVTERLNCIKDISDDLIQIQSKDNDISQSFITATKDYLDICCINDFEHFLYNLKLYTPIV